jgi:hypothetical protein
MTALTYTIAGHTFETQKDLVVHVQAILRRYPAPARLTGDDAAVMGDLLLRHPHAEIKIGVGVAAIWIRRNSGGFGNGFFVERIDGVFVDFSYKQCVRPQTNASKAKFAFRRAIDSQVIAVKRAVFDTVALLSCPITGKPMTWDTAHVDHEPPRTFAALLAEYCTLRGVDLDTLELFEPKSGIGKILPPAIEQDWAAWHAERAQLRVISAEANIKLVR